MIRTVGGAIDGGSGAADAPREPPPERWDTDWLQGLDVPELTVVDPPPVSGNVVEDSEPYSFGPAPIAEGFPGDRERYDDHAAGGGLLGHRVYLRELSVLSEIEQQSVTDSLKGFLKYAERRALSVAADHAFPVIGGRIVDLTFEVYDVATSVRALSSDDPVLEAPLPSPVPGLDFGLEIPLAKGEDGHVPPPLALCIAPDTPSLTGGWALDSPDKDERIAGSCESGHAVERLPDAAGEEELERELEQLKAASRRRKPTDTAAQLELRAANRSATGCAVETDLGSLPLLKRRKLRAWELGILAREYAPQLRENLDLSRFEVLVIIDRQQRCGLWIWLGSDLGEDIVAFQ